MLFAAARPGRRPTPWPREGGMFSKSRDRLRHQRLMDVADDLVLHAPLPEAVTPAQIAASAFGRYRLEISEAEALKYLAAVLIGRNHPFDHLSHPTD